MRISPRIRFVIYMALMIVGCFTIAWGVTRIVKGVDAFLMAEPAHSPSEFESRR